MSMEYLHTNDDTSQEDVDLWGTFSIANDISSDFTTEQEETQTPLRDCLDPDTIYYFIRQNDISSLDDFLKNFGYLFNLNAIDPYLMKFHPTWRQSSVKGNQLSKSFPTSTQPEFTPLMIACQYGHEGIIQLLIEKYHASPLLTNHTGHCALHFAISQGLYGIVVSILSQWYQPTRLTSELQTHGDNQDLLQYIVSTFTKTSSHFQSDEKTKDFMELLNLLLFSGKHALNLLHCDSNGNTVAHLLTQFFEQYAIHPSNEDESSTQMIHATSPSPPHRIPPLSLLEKVPPHLIHLLHMVEPYYLSFESYLTRIMSIISDIITALCHHDCQHNEHSTKELWPSSVSQAMSNLSELLSQPIYTPFIWKLFTCRDCEDNGPPSSPGGGNSLDDITNDDIIDQKCDSGFFEILVSMYLDAVSSTNSHGNVSFDANVDHHWYESIPSHKAFHHLAFNGVTSYSPDTIRFYTLLDKIFEMAAPILAKNSTTLLPTDGSFLSNTSNSSIGQNHTIQADHEELSHPPGSTSSRSREMMPLLLTLAQTSISPYSGATILMHQIEDDNRDYLELQLLQSEYRLYISTHSSTGDPQLTTTLASDPFAQSLRRKISNIQRKIVYRVELIHYMLNPLAGQPTASPHTEIPTNWHISTNPWIHFAQLTAHDRLGLTIFDHISSTYNTPLMYRYICQVSHHHHVLLLKTPLLHETMMDKTRWFRDAQKLTFVEMTLTNPYNLSSIAHMNDYHANPFNHQRDAMSPLDDLHERHTAFSYSFHGIGPESASDRSQFFKQRWDALYTSQKSTWEHLRSISNQKDNRNPHAFHPLNVPLVYRFTESYEEICRHKLRSRLILVSMTANDLKKQKQAQNDSISLKTIANNGDDSLQQKAPLVSSKPHFISANVIFQLVTLIDNEFNRITGSHSTLYFNYRHLFSLQTIDDQDGLFEASIRHLLHGPAENNDVDSFLSSSIETSQHMMSFLTLIRLSLNGSTSPVERYQQIIDTVKYDHDANGQLTQHSTSQARIPSRIDLHIYHDTFTLPLLTTQQYVMRILQLDCNHFADGLDIHAQFNLFVAAIEQDIINYSNQCVDIYETRTPIDATTINTSINVKPDHFMDTFALLEICLLRLFGMNDAPTLLLGWYHRCLDSHLVNHPCFIHFLRLFMLYYLHLPPTAGFPPMMSSDNHDADARDQMERRLAPLFILSHTSVADMELTPYQLILHHCDLHLIVPQCEYGSITQHPGFSDGMPVENNHITKMTIPLLYTHLFSLYESKIIPSQYLSHLYVARQTSSRMSYSLLTSYVEKFYAYSTGCHPLRGLENAQPNVINAARTPPDELSPDLSMIDWFLSLPQSVMSLNDKATSFVQFWIYSPNGSHNASAMTIDHDYSSQETVFTILTACTLWSRSMMPLIRYVFTHPTLTISATDHFDCLASIMYHNHYQTYYPLLFAHIRQSQSNSPPNHQQQSIYPPYIPFHRVKSLNRHSKDHDDSISNPFNALIDLLSHDYTSKCSFYAYIHSLAQSDQHSQTSETTTSPHQLEYKLAVEPRKKSIWDTARTVLSYYRNNIYNHHDNEQSISPPHGVNLHTLLFDAIDLRVKPSMLEELIIMGLDPRVCDTRHELQMDVQYDPTVNQKSITNQPNTTCKSTQYATSLMAYILHQLIQTLNSMPTTEHSQLQAQSGQNIGKNKSKELDTKINDTFRYFEKCVMILKDRGYFKDAVISPSFSCRDIHENLLYPLVILPHQHANASSYFPNVFRLIRLLVQSMPYPALGSFFTSLSLDTLSQGVYRVENKEIQTSTAQIAPPLPIPQCKSTHAIMHSALSIIMNPPNYLHHRTLWATQQNKHKLLQLLIDAKINVSSIVHNTQDFSLDMIMSDLKTNYQSQNITHNILTLHSALTLCLTLPTASEMLPLLLSSRHANVCIRVPRVVLGPLATIYQPIATTTASNQHLLRHLFGERLKRQSSHTLFHTTSIEISLLHNDAPHSLLDQLTAHSTYSPDQIYHNDHHVDCILTAVCHSSCAHTLIPALQRNGCIVGHGILRYSHQDDNGIRLDRELDKDNPDALVLHWNTEDGQQHVHYHQMHHYGSLHAYYPPLAAVEWVISHLSHIQSRAESIAQAKTSLLMDFAECTPNITGDKRTLPPEYEPEIDQCRDITPFIQSYGILLHSVLFYSIIMPSTTGEALYSDAVLLSLLKTSTTGTPREDCDQSSLIRQHGCYMALDNYIGMIPANEEQHTMCLSNITTAFHSLQYDNNNNNTSNMPSLDSIIKTHFKDCLDLQSDIHPLLLFAALGSPKCVEIMSILDAFDDGNTFNIPSTIHPYTNDTVLLYAIQFHCYDAHMVSIVQVLLQTYHCLANVISSYFRLSLIELLFVPYIPLKQDHTMILSSNEPSVSPPSHIGAVPEFPVDIFKQLIEHRCDIRRYSRPTGSKRYASKLLALACYNDNLHNVAQTTKRRYSSTYITPPRTFRRSFSKSPSHVNLGDHKVTPPVISQTKYEDTAPKQVTGAEIVLSTLMELGVSPLNDGSPHPVAGNKPDDPLKGMQSHLLLDIIRRYLKTIPYGVIASIIQHGATINDAITMATLTIDHPDDPDAVIDIFELFYAQGHRYSMTNPRSDNVFMQSLFSHPRSHRLLELMLSDSEMPLNLMDMSPSHVDKIFDPTTNNAIDVAKVITKHGYFANPGLIKPHLHTGDVKVLQTFDTVRQPIWLNMLKRCLQEVESMNLPGTMSTLEKVQHIRKALGIRTLHAFDFRMVTQQTELGSMMSKCQSYDMFLPLLVLFYHIPGHTTLDQLLRVTITTDPPRTDSVSIKQAKDIDEFTQLYNDPPSVYLKDYNHPMYFFALRDALLNPDLLQLPLDGDSLVLVEAFAITLSQSPHLTDFPALEAYSLDFSQIMQHHLNPPSQKQRDQDLQPKNITDVIHTRTYTNIQSDESDESQSESDDGQSSSTNSNSYASSDSNNLQQDHSFDHEYELVSYPSYLPIQKQKQTALEQVNPSIQPHSPKNPKKKAIKSLATGSKSTNHGNRLTSTTFSQTSPSSTYHDYMPPMEGLTIARPTWRQLMMINCKLLVVNDDKNQLLKTIPPFVCHNANSLFMYFSIFCFTFYLYYPFGKWKKEEDNSHIKHVHLALMNPLLTYDTVQMLLVPSIYRRQCRALQDKQQAISIMVYRHNADHYFDFLFLLTTIMELRLATAIPVYHKETKQRIDLTPIVILTMFEGNSKCIQYILKQFYTYRGKPRMSARELDSLQAHCRPEYHHLFGEISF